GVFMLDDIAVLVDRAAEGARARMRPRFARADRHARPLAVVAGWDACFAGREVRLVGGLLRRERSERKQDDGNALHTATAVVCKQYSFQETPFGGAICTTHKSRTHEVTNCRMIAPLREGAMSRTAWRVILAFVSLGLIAEAQTGNVPSTKNGDWP